MDEGKCAVKFKAISILDNAFNQSVANNYLSQKKITDFINGVLILNN